MAEPSLLDEYNEIIQKAQNKPGVAEIMRAYGRYNEIEEQSKAYMTNKPLTSKSILSTRSS